MALIKCPECEKEISDKATSCPNCGCPLNDFGSKSATPVFQDCNNDTSTQSYSCSKQIPVKTIAIIVCIIVVVGIAIIYFCNRKPSNITDEMYNYGESAIKVVDDYLDNEISYNAAKQKLDGIESSADFYYDNEQNDSSYAPEFLVKSSISLLNLQLSSENSGISTYSDLLESRNDLAEKLNITKRRK